jgi:hypothetical protein
MVVISPMKNFPRDIQANIMLVRFFISPGGGREILQND